MSAKSNVWIGLDVHKESITAAVFEGMGSRAAVVQRLPNDLVRVKRFLGRWARRGELRICYEASGAGYVLQRAVEGWGWWCELVAPSLIPVKPGERRKHDRRDAMQLGLLYRAGELTVIHVPSEAEERVREPVRCRGVFQKEITQSRHYVLKLLRRRGFIYREGNHWTKRHHAWLRGVAAKLEREDRRVYEEYLALLEYKVSRREELDREIEAVALKPPYAAIVGRIRCFRGFNVHSAMVLATEIVDFRRFESPRQLMAYLGLVPTEHSSGGRERRGPITKAGNSRCRHVLIQAAWHYRLTPVVGEALKRRQRGQPVQVVAHAWKAQHRLHKVYHRIAHRKCSQVAVVASARELVGFLWAVLQDVNLEKEKCEKYAA